MRYRPRVRIAAVPTDGMKEAPSVARHFGDVTSDPSLCQLIQVNNFFCGLVVRRAVFRRQRSMLCNISFNFTFLLLQRCWVRTLTFRCWVGAGASCLIHTFLLGCQPFRRVHRIPMQCPHQLIAELASDAPHVVGFRSVLVAYGMNTKYGAGTQKHQHGQHHLHPIQRLCPSPPCFQASSACDAGFLDPTRRTPTLC